MWMFGILKSVTSELYSVVILLISQMSAVISGYVWIHLFLYTSKPFYTELRVKSTALIGWISSMIMFVKASLSNKRSIFRHFCIQMSKND